MQTMSRRGGVFYGWIVVAAVAFILAVSSGARFAFGVFLKPISDAHDWDRGALSFAITISMVLGGLLQPAAGWVVDRVGARVVGTFGMALIGLSFAGMAAATELWQVYLLYGVLGAVGVACTSSVLSAKLVGSWFVDRRGTALSFSSSGTAIGQLLIVPFAAWVLLEYGFVAGLQAIAAIALLLVAPFAWLAIRNEPAELALEPDGVDAPPASGPAAGDGVDLSVALRSPIFWQLSFGLVACGVTMSFPSTHLMPYAADMHMPELTAGAALGLAGGLSLPAAIAVGWLADRVGRGRVLALVYALRGLTYVLLLGATTETVWFLAAFALGLSWTGTVPLSAAIAADAFGRRNLATITGTMVMGMWVAAGLAALASGMIYDHLHSYYLALIGNGLLAFAAASICLGIVGERGLPYASQRPATAS
jgi:MFS family permease